MMDRTTLRIEHDVYERVKKISLIAHKDVQEIVNEALVTYLPTLQRKIQEPSRKRPKFGSYSLQFKGGSRKEIYENR